MPTAFVTNRTNCPVPPAAFRVEDQTSSHVSLDDWSEIGLHAYSLAAQPDTRAFLVNGTGAMGIIVIVPAHQMATSFKNSLCGRDFLTYVEDAHLSLLWESIWPVARLYDIRAAISTIKFNFSLPVSHLADVLRVSRPTVYAWLDEEIEIRIQAFHQRRIEQLASYAELWWARASGRRFPKELFDSSFGSMLLDLLKAEILNDQLIRKAIEALCASLPVKRKLATVKGVGPVPTDEPGLIDEMADL